MPFIIEDVYSAIFSLILIIIYIIIGLTIASKYFKIRQRTFLFVGIAWILLSMLWWSSVINVFLLLLDPNGIGLSAEGYFLFTGILQPVCHYLFITGFTDLIFKKYQKYFQVVVIIIGIVFYIVVFYFLFTDVNFLIIKEDPARVKIPLTNPAFTLIFLVLTLYIGFSFAIDSIKSENKIVSIKGKLIAIALILLPIGGLMDSVILYSFLDFLDRILLIASVIIFYFGFNMPNWFKTRILKKGTENLPKKD